MSCPQCTGRIAAAGGDWFRCTVCRYEIHTDAWGLHQELLRQLDEDPAKFFKAVDDRLRELRAAEPVWQRTR